MPFAASDSAIRDPRSAIRFVQMAAGILLPLLASFGSRHGTQFGNIENPQAPPSDRRQLWFTGLRFVLGVFLLTSAGLKIEGLTNGSWVEESLTGSLQLQVAAVELELLLGLWLLCGWATRAAWMASIIFFLLLTFLSLSMALTGQASCGCFGRLKVNPWYTFGLDVVVLAALLLCRPGFSSNAMPKVWPEIRWIAIGAVAFLGITAGLFFLVADDPASTLAHLRGESVIAEPGVTDVGEGSVGIERKFRVELTNHADHPIRIVGGTSHCSCLATESLPITLPQGEGCSIDVWVKFRGSAGRFRHAFILLTDDRTQGKVIAQFAGRVVPNEE